MSFLTTKIVSGSPDHLQLDRAEMRVTAGNDKGLHFELGPESIRIGSDASCQIVLHDSAVSRHHAEIRATERGFLISDLGSKNGIVAARVPIQRAFLVHGLRLEMGETTLVVRRLGSVQSVPLVDPGRFGGLVAHSLAMRATVAVLVRLAETDSTVLIEGETGSGKEAVARALHSASMRSARPFVVLDCGALSADLVASTLFGHERGAFSGAHSSRVGLLEEAAGGTLFVDEVGELPLDLQPMLLRAVERKEVRRVGGAKIITEDVRIIAATNRNLAEECRLGRFREDLYFRLAVARVRVPPLRERPEDLPVLAEEFAGLEGIDLDPEIISTLRGHSWPGNIRELRNVIERLRVIPSAAIFDRDEGPHQNPCRSGNALMPLAEARRLANSQFEERYLREALLDSGGNLSRAAELAGVSRQTMTQLAKKHGLRALDREGSDGA